MKSFVCILFIIVLLLGSQVNAQTKNFKVYDKGTSSLVAGQGIGNIWKTFMKQAINYPGISYKVSSLGPLTLIYEYGFGKHISGGLALGYSRITGRYSGFGDEFTDRLTIFSALARANYHFGHSGRFDPYLGIGMGYVRSKYDNSGSNSKRSVPGEFGYSGQLGAKYLFTPHIGVYAEAGYVGGSFVQAGLAVIF
jgi:outer membrane protein W